MRCVKTFFCLLTIALMLNVTTLSANDPIDYTLRDLDGKDHSLSQYQGKWVVMNFWAT